MKRLLIMGVLLAMSAGAQAEVGFFGSVGYNHGGDDLATIIFTDGSSQTIKAGSGLALNLGLVHDFGGTSFALQSTIGYLVENTSAANTNARFSRYPVEVTGFWRQADHRFGAGLVNHFSPTLDLDNLGGTLDFDRASGFVIEYGYRMFSMRYTSIEYSVSGYSGGIDGSGIGIFYSTGF